MCKSEKPKTLLEVIKGESNVEVKEFFKGFKREILPIMKKEKSITHDITEIVDFTTNQSDSFRYLLACNILHDDELKDVKNVFPELFKGFTSKPFALTIGNKLRER